MRDRRLALGGAIAVIVCCATPALAAGLVGGATLAVIRGFTPVAAIVLGLVIVFAGRLVRRRPQRAPLDSTNVACRSTAGQETAA